MNDLDYLFVFSDKTMFWMLQLTLMSLVVISIFKSRVGKGAVSVSIDRGKESVAIFYGAYISISGLLACSGPLILDTFQATFSNSAIF